MEDNPLAAFDAFNEAKRKAEMARTDFAEMARQIYMAAAALREWDAFCAKHRPGRARLPPDPLAGLTWPAPEPVAAAIGQQRRHLNEAARAYAAIPPDQKEHLCAD